MYMHEVFTFSYTLCMFYSAVGKAKYTEIHTKLSLAIILEIHASFLFAAMKSLYIYIYIVQLAPGTILFKSRLF